MLLLHDIDGRELWRKELDPGSRCANIVALDWFGNGEARELAVTSRDSALPIHIFNGQGEVVQSFAPTMSLDEPFDKHRAPCIAAADVWGDSRDELIVHEARNVKIYANSSPRALPNLYNTTHYRGM